MNNDLIKRYIYAVISHLPAKSQPDVENELENMITELLDARCCGAEPADEDIREVLTELGSPEELAVKYSGDENKALISGIYLLWFKKVLKIVLPIAAAGAAFAALLSAFVTWQAPREMYEFMPELAGNVITSALSAAIQAVLWVGLIFAVLEYKKVKFSGDEFLSKLRPVPDKRAQIKIHEPIINILWHIAAAILLLGFPFLIGGYTESAGWIPALDETYIRGVWYLVVLWTIFGTIHEIFKLFERRYSKRLALVTVITNVLTGLFAGLFFADSSIINPEFVKKVGSMVEGVASEEIGIALGHVNFLILGIMLLALLLEIGVTSYRAFRYDK